jgi:hypothetical protein
MDANMGSNAFTVVFIYPFLKITMEGRQNLKLIYNN